MTERNPALYIQSQSHGAEDLRQLIAAMSSDVSGLIGAADLKVAAHGTPNMSVDVAGGRACIAGTENTYQGTYFCHNRGTTNLTIAASDPTHARWDLVVAKVQDDAYSGATGAWSLAVVTGTPAGSPALPSAPANSISLAKVVVNATATTITSGNITDLRPAVVALGSSLPQGKLNYVSTTSGVGSITTTPTTVVSTGTINFSTSARLIKITAVTVGLSTVGGDFADLAIFGGATQLARCSTELVNGASGYTMRVEAIISPSAGSHSYAAKLTRTAGSGTLSSVPSSTDPTFILVEDIGLA